MEGLKEKGQVSREKGLGLGRGHMMRGRELDKGQ
jgi:hypothetical protein